MKKIPLDQQFDIGISLDLGTLGVADVITAESSIDGSRKQGFRVTKSKILLEMSGKTAGEGPILFGVAANFPGAPEVELALEADPQGRNEQDSARGKGTFLKVLALFMSVPINIPTTRPQMFEFSYGKNGWSVPEAEKLVYWARNQDTSALTTGTRISISAEHFGVWLRD